MESLNRKGATVKYMNKMEKISIAKQKIYAHLSKFVEIEKLEEACSKIIVYDDDVEFWKEYGEGEYSSKVDCLEGFNRNGISYLSTSSTVHTIIHEVLHTLSSEFDKDGHRTANGIIGTQSTQFGNMINEGLTDYLACKMSGEEPRHYMKGHKLFSRIDKMGSELYQDNDFLLKWYLEKDDLSFKKFVDKLSKKGMHKKLYDEFMFMDNEAIDKLLNKMEKVARKKSKWNAVLRFFKGNTQRDKQLLVVGKEKEEKPKEVNVLRRDIKYEVKKLPEQINPGQGVQKRNTNRERD